MATKPFQQPEIFRVLFENSSDAQYVLSVAGENDVFLAVNPAFEQFLGYAAEELLSGAVRPADVISEDDFPDYTRRRERATDPGIVPRPNRYEMQLRAKDGSLKDVEISVRPVEIRGKTYGIGSIRDIAERKKLEQHLREEAENQRASAMETVRRNVMVFQLTEKLKNTPILSRKMLAAVDTKSLMNDTVAFLTSDAGMKFHSATIYVKKGKNLFLAGSNDPDARGKIPVNEDNRYTRALREKTAREYPADVAFVLPIVSQDKSLGVLEVTYDRAERALLDGNPLAKRGYEDIVSTVASLIGLAHHNTRLTKELRRLSITDRTGCFNRRYLDAKLKSEFNRSSRYGRDLSLVLLDLDRFKDVNDAYGHQAGDKVLVELVELIEVNSRRNDVVFRFGGDEFVILLVETNLPNAVAKAVRLASIIAGSAFTNIVKPDEPIHITISAGVAYADSQVLDEQELVKLADSACYHSKGTGRNRITYYEFGEGDERRYVELTCDID